MRFPFAEAVRCYCFLPLLLVFTGVPVLNREKEEARRDAFNFTATLARAFAFLATLI